MLKVNAIYFDVEGTLISRIGCINYEDIIEIFLEYGVMITVNMWKAAYDYVTYIDYPRYGYKRMRSFMKRVLYRLNINYSDDLLNDLTRYYSKHLKYRLYEDVKPSIKALKKAGFSLGIVSDIPYFMFREYIWPIKRYFDVILTSYELGCDKSCPLAYRKAAKYLNTTADKILVVGDHPVVDVAVPIQAGMKAVLLARDNVPKFEVKPSAVIKSLYDLVNILD